jgi:purine-binding chemotaxis protein CheW
MLLKTQNSKPQNGRNGSMPPVGVKLNPARVEDEIGDPGRLTEVWSRRADALAEEPPAVATGQTLDLLVFSLGDEQYGVEVANVREIYPLEQLTPVPRTPNFVAGVFSARGRILSVINLHAFLGLPSSPPSVAEGGQAKIIIVANTAPTSETVHMEVGLLVDQVANVITIFKEELKPPLSTQTGVRADYLQGITADMLVALNLNALLGDKQLIVHEEL